jgi:hypothetical protein
MPIGRSRRMRRAYSRSRDGLRGGLPTRDPGSMSVVLRISSRSPASDLAEPFPLPDPAAQQGPYVRLWAAQHQIRRALHLRQQVGIPA